MHNEIDTVEEELMARYRIDRKRDLLVPDRKFCRLNLTQVAEAAKKRLKDDNEDFSSLPSWPKATLFPFKCKAFLSTFFEAIGPGVARLEYCDIDWQIQQNGLEERTRYVCSATGNKILVELMFFNTRTNAQLRDLSIIYQEAVPNTWIIVLSGDKINGSAYTNENAQKKVLRIIRKAAKQGKNVMILASRLGQRSFSIPSLSTVYLCYDNGGEAATRQKLARALTPDTEEKVGWIISCSFNPTTDDKLLPEMIATAKNLRKKNRGSFKDNLKYVVRSENILDMTDTGFHVVDSDDWYNHAYEDGMITRVLGAMSNPYAANDELRELLMRASGWAPPPQDIDIAPTGKTYEGKPNKERVKAAKSEEKEMADAITKMRAALTYLIEIFPRMQIGTGKRQVSEILDAILDDQDHRQWFQKRFNMDVSVVFMCIDQGVIDEESLEARLG